jgi:hypothetical protein
MRSSWKSLVVLMAAALAVPTVATADDVAEQLRIMQEQMAQLETDLESTNADIKAANSQVEEQGDLLTDAGVGDRSASSWLSSFLTQTTFDGFVAASYTYNFNDPSDTVVDQGSYENTGVLNNVAPYHGDANNFQLDQAWFGMEKAATADSRGGFRVDLVFGKSAGIHAYGYDYGGDGGENHVDLYQAYAQYLAPVTDEGISIKAGRYETVIGAESFKQNQNFNVTRGIIWGLQPVTHTGVLFEGACGDCNIDWALGVSNSFTNSDSDTDNSKTGVGRVRWTGENTSIAISGLLGGDVDESYFGRTGSGDERDADAIPMLDVVLTWDPSENLSTWINYTHIFNPINGNIPQDISIWGIAAAGRYAINERTGISTRVEFLHMNSVFQNNNYAPNNYGMGSGDAFQWAITATLDHALTDNLTFRIEGRFDTMELEGAPDDTFVSNHDPNNGERFSKDHQFLALVELLYEF